MPTQDPKPRTFQQILGDAEDAVMSRTGLTGLRKNGSLLDVLESVSQVAARSAQDTFAALNATDPTRLQGEQLDRYGNSRGRRRQSAQPARTTVVITDSSFGKVSTVLSPLAPPPVPGQDTIRVRDASAFTAAGSVYLGRGSSSLEGPLAYSSKINNGSDWTLVLVGVVNRRHDGSETVVLAQGGDRTVAAGSLCRTSQGNALSSATYQVLSGTTLLDGETSLEDVEVLCTQPGESGNVPAGAISAWVSDPFSGAGVSNPRPVTSGRNVQKDPDYLEDIRDANASASGGTEVAIESSSVGVTAPDEPRTVTSASYVERVGPEPAYLTIDDGTGYQPTIEGVSREQLCGSAGGGERDFELGHRPVSKAAVRTRTPPPWAVGADTALAFEVAGVATQHRVRPLPSALPMNPYSLAADVNADQSIDWEAVVADEGRSLSFRAKSEYRDDIRSVSTVDATDLASVLGLHRQRESTLLLYRSDTGLRKDGLEASIVSRPFSRWGVMVGPQTLVLDVDGTGSITYTISDSDFAGTGYSPVGRNSPAAWAVALSRRIPGVTAKDARNVVRLTSNLGADQRASLRIAGGTLVGAGVFSTGSVEGYASDYLLNRSTGELELASSLVAGEVLSAGTDQTRGYLAAIVPSPVTFASPATWWLAVDSKATTSDLSITPATTFAVTIPTAGLTAWGCRLRLTSPVGSYSGLSVGDYVVFWDPSAPVDLVGAWYVAQVAPDGSWFELDRRQGYSARYAGASCALSAGRVLVCGGFGRPDGTLALRTAEIYDPSTQTWTPTGPMLHPRGDHWAVALPSGDILVGGGTTGGGFAGATLPAEVWNHITGAWTATTSVNAPIPALGAAACVVGGVAYVSGGQDITGNYEDTLNVYDEVGPTWAVLPNMAAARARHTMTAAGTTIWVAGGEDGGVVLNSGEQFDTVGVAWAAGGTLVVARQGHRASLVGGNLLLTGGSSAVSTAPAVRLASTELLVALALPWVASGAMSSARYQHGHAALSDGTSVLASGGEAAAAQAELYDSGMGTWSPAGLPHRTPRSQPILESVGSIRAIMAFGYVDSRWPDASSEQWESNAWTATDPLAGITFSLSSGGASFGSSLDRLCVVQIGAAAAQTATAVQAGVNTASSVQCPGVSVDRKTTTKLRWRTNTWGAPSETSPAGDLFVAAANVPAKLVGFPEGRRAESTEGQAAWTISGTTQTGTPEFQSTYIAGSSGFDTPSISWYGMSDPKARPSPSCYLLGMGGDYESYAATRVGQVRGFETLFSSRDTDGGVTGATYLHTRMSPEHGWTPLDRACVLNPWALGPEDDLVVVADGDADGRKYAINTFRRLRPVGSTYGITCQYQDADASPLASLGTTFGTGYDFTDHSVYMRARGKSHPSDAARSVLWRWWRHGSEGEFATVAYGVPSGPSVDVGISIDDTSDTKTNVLVTLASGALKTGAQVRPSTMVGISAVDVVGSRAKIRVVFGLTVATAQVTANLATLTLTLPTDVLNHGIPVGAMLWLESTDPNFPSGLKFITAVTASTVSYAYVHANVGPDALPGTVSWDLAEARVDTLTPALTVNDWVKFLPAATDMFSPILGLTTRCDVAGAQELTVIASGWIAPVNTTIEWGQLGDPVNLEVFANPAQTVSAIATAVNSLHAAGASPVQPTVLGTGTGTILKSTEDELGSGIAYSLFDGMNAVSSQVLPGTPTTPYTFTLKDPIEPSIATNSDWAAEDVRIAPVSASHLAAWLQSQATSGLWPGIRSEPAGRSRRLQLWSQATGSRAAVQVASGSASTWAAPLVGQSYSAEDGMVCSIDAASARGFVSGGWASLFLTAPADRPAFSASSTITSLTASGKLILDHSSPVLWSGPAGSTHFQANISLSMEVIDGYVRIQDVGLGTSMDLAGLGEGDWILLAAPAAPTPSTPQIADINSGMFRVVRVNTDGGLTGAQCLWIEATTHVNSGPVEADIRLLADDSILPGDEVVFGSDVWGSDNVGAWKVSALGNAAGSPWADRWTINLDATTRSPSPFFGPVTLGAQSSTFRAVPPTAQRWIKKVRSLVPGSDGLVRVRLEGGSGWSNANEAHGAILKMLDKLEFPGEEARGRDAYSYHTGLVGEVNRIIVGDPGDPSTYPGVEAAGVSVRVDGPKIRPVSFAMAIRLREGYNPGDAIQASRSAIVAAIQGYEPHGHPIPVSNLVSRTAAVQGVVSAVPLSSYSAADDEILVLPGEKARVLNPQSDISITIIG